MQFLKKWFGRIFVAVLAIILLYEGWTYVRVLRLAQHNPTETALMAARKHEMAAAGEPIALKQQWRPISRISPYLQHALIVSEDATFYGHEGFDWEGIKVAAEKNLKQGKVVAGGSTITQQLAKNLFLSTQRTPWRKAQEALITVMLEKTLSKRRIFEIYLNVIEWGDGVFGAQAAAQHYFGKNAAQLTPREAAKLASMVPDPRYYDAHPGSRHLQHKTRIILARMKLRYGPGFNGRPIIVRKTPASPTLPDLQQPRENDASSPISASGDHSDIATDASAIPPPRDDTDIPATEATPANLPSAATHSPDRAT